MSSKGAKIPLDADTREYNRKIKEADRITKEIGKSAAAQRKEWEKQLPILGKINSKTMDIKAGAAAITVTVGAIAAAWKQVEAAKDKAMQANLGHLDSSKRLAQVATSPEEMLQLRHSARRFAATAGISQDRANNVIFSLQSAGDMQSLESFERASMVESDIEGLIRGVHTTKGAFGGTTQQSMNQLFAASRQSKFSTSELAGGSATAGKAVAATGTSQAQFLALLGSEFGTKSADVTATGLRAFANESANNKLLSKLRGSDLIETTKNIQEYMRSKGIADKDLGTIVKGLEAQQGFRTIGSAISKGTLAQKIAEIENSGGAVDGLVNNLDAQTKAGIVFRQSEVNEEIANETAGIEETLQEAGFNNKNATKANRNFLARGYQNLENAILDFFPTSTENVVDSQVLNTQTQQNVLSNSQLEQSAINAEMRADIKRMADGITSMVQSPARGAKEE